MSSPRIVAGTIGLTILFLIRALWLESAARPALPYGIYESDTTAAEPFAIDESFVEHEDARRMDKFGNEVEAAVGDYRVDPRGDVYERHSPQTALQRLASAGT